MVLLFEIKQLFSENTDEIEVWVFYDEFTLKNMVGFKRKYN